jgi:biotin synthase
MPAILWSNHDVRDQSTTMTVTTESTPALRHDWTAADLRAIHDQPITELLFQAQTVHRRHHDPTQVQMRK